MTEAADVEALPGTRWVLVAWSASTLDPDEVRVTASFEADAISGVSAVNRYRATWSATPDGNLMLGPAMTTRMAGPEGLMRAETTFHALLAGVRAFRIADDGGSLALLDEAGTEVLTFAREP